MIVMLFEDLERGVMRTIYTKRGHQEKLEPTWMGDSVGHWEGDSLIVDTIGFNDRTWLNDAGAQLPLLVGDVNGSKLVDGNDVSAVQAKTRQAATSSNFRLDVNASGLIDGNDVSVTQGKTRTSLPH